MCGVEFSEFEFVVAKLRLFVVFETRTVRSDVQGGAPVSLLQSVNSLLCLCLRLREQHLKTDQFRFLQFYVLCRDRKLG